MESKKKHRTLNEYRQVKDTVYRHPHKKKPNHKYNNLIQDIKTYVPSTLMMLILEEHYAGLLKRSDTLFF